ncbi:MAG: hypothetical protein ACYCPQ_00435 [Elusimicrobiota bacterium]
MSNLPDEDEVKQWIVTCCQRSSQGTAFTKELFASWQVWAEKGSSWAGTAKGLSLVLERLEFRRWRSAKGRGFCGLAVRNV